MIYALDLEFLNRGYGYPIDLISLGVAAEDGRTLYVQNAEFEPERASVWVRENVLVHLEHPDCIGRMRGPRCSIGCPWRPYASTIGAELQMFVGVDENPEFWVDYGAFDFVIVSQIIGTFEAWPKRWPMYFKDIQQWQDYVAVVLPPELEDSDHHAGRDAEKVLAKYREISAVVYGER